MEGFRALFKVKVIEQFSITSKGLRAHAAAPGAEVVWGDFRHQASESFGEGRFRNRTLDLSDTRG